MSTMTNRQAAFIRTLVEERDLDANNEARVETLRDMIRAGQPVPSAAASIVIAELLKAPRRKPATNETTDTDPRGTYRLADGRIVRIVLNREGTRHYGKVWDADADTWLFLPGAMNRIRNARRLTLEEAEEFGVLTGQCAMCGRTLTVKASIARGIGPKCADKF